MGRFLLAGASFTPELKNSSYVSGINIKEFSSSKKVIRESILIMNVIMELDF